MDLALRDSAKPFCFMAKTSHKSVGFKMGLSLETKEGHGEAEEGRIHVEDDEEERSSTDPPVQLDFLPLLPVSHQRQAHQFGFPWPSENGNSKAEVASTRGFDVNRAPFGGDLEEEAAVSSPNSTVSSFHMDFGVLSQSRRDPDGVHNVGEGERASSRASDEEENGLCNSFRYAESIETSRSSTQTRSPLRIDLTVQQSSYVFLIPRRLVKYTTIFPSLPGGGDGDKGDALSKLPGVPEPQVRRLHRSPSETRDGGAVLPPRWRAGSGLNFGGQARPGPIPTLGPRPARLVIGQARVGPISLDRAR
ncbi:hypothetical protein EJ110_NYTH14161 [Nymphaea thermarum]|nr:hypothetical protein EJ110_NYTH14161 [Nymphaea thermarum]